MDEFQIRLATISDIPAIMGLWNDLMTFHLPFNSFFELRADAAEKFRVFLNSNIQNTDKAHVYVAVGTNQVIGYVMGLIHSTAPVFKIDQVGEIMDAFVANEYRRHNLGERLFNELKKWFQKQKVDRIDVSIAVGNSISSTFWAKMGFKPLLQHLYLEI